MTPSAPSEGDFQTLLVKSIPRMSEAMNIRVNARFKKLRHSVRDASLQENSGYYLQKQIIMDAENTVVIIGLLHEPSFLKRIGFRLKGLI